MCEKCVRRLKHLGVPKNQYGKIKALSHRFIKPFGVRVTKKGNYYVTGSVPLFCDRRLNVGIEAHLHKIFRTQTNKKIYRRNRCHSSAG